MVLSNTFSFYFCTIMIYLILYIKYAKIKYGRITEKNTYNYVKRQALDYPLLIYYTIICLYHFLGLATNSRKPMQYSQIGKSIEITGSPVPITPRRLRAISCADLLLIKSKLDNITIRYETLCV